MFAKKSNLAKSLAMVVTVMSSAAWAGPTCQIDRVPEKSASQQLKDRLTWGRWEAFDESMIRIDSAPQPTPTYHVLSKYPGTSPNTQKPLILFLHGYPEFAWSWENWLKLIGGSHDAIAIDLKGFGESSKPTEQSAYELKRVVDEIDDLVTCLGYKQVIPIGHDWGGTFAWMYSMYHADKTKALVVLSTPHPYTFYRELAKPDSEQRKRSEYMDQIRQGTTSSLAAYFLGLSKDTSLFGPFYQWPRVNRLLKNNMNSLAKWDAMFNYYRVMEFPPDPTVYTEQPSASMLSMMSVKVPTLAYYGKDDPYFSIDSWRGVDAFVPKLDFKLLEGEGHFINHDAEQLPQEVLDFINRQVN